MQRNLPLYTGRPKSLISDALVVILLDNLFLLLERTRRRGGRNGRFQCVYVIPEFDREISFQGSFISLVHVDFVKGIKNMSPFEVYMVNSKLDRFFPAF